MTTKKFLETDMTELLVDRCSVCGIPGQILMDSRTGHQCDVCEELGFGTTLCSNESCTVVHMESHGILQKR